MRLKLHLVSEVDGRGVDLVIGVDPTATVADVADALASRDPSAQSMVTGRTLATRVGAERLPLRLDATIAEAGLRSGQWVSLVDAGQGLLQDEDAFAVLHVLNGPSAGKQHPLRSGSNDVGRDPDNEVVLDDLYLSKKHARINVTDVVEVLDLGSSNGVQVGGVDVTRATLSADDEVLMGDTRVRVVPTRTLRRTGELAAAEPLLRSPRLEPVWSGPVVNLPDAPERPQAGRMSFIPLFMPLLFGGVMYAVTQQIATVLFVALSPLMMLGNLAESRYGARKAYAHARQAFLDSTSALRQELDAQLAQEVVGRLAEHPGAEEVLAAGLQRTDLTWSRRPDRAGWLQLRLGVGPQPSRATVEPPRNRPSEPDLSAELRDLQQHAALVSPVPVVADLRSCGAVGVAGVRAGSLSAARALVAQLVGLHSPAEVVLCGLAGVAAADDWDWLKWLPHTTSDHSPLPGDHLAAGAGQGGVLLTALEELLAARGASDNAALLPAVMLIADGDAGCDRSRIVELAERGPSLGLHVLWVASSVQELPAACRTYLEVATGTATVGRTDDGSTVVVTPEQIAAASVSSFARSMAPLVDAGARLEDATDLPRTVSTLQLVGTELAANSEAVLDVWRTSGSLPGEGRSRRHPGLRAQVGMTSGQKLVLDLREQGPHALVGGTTGAGKSEFLQSWVMGMALEHSPSRVTFLFVDYKGGAAFSECTRLPHCVGLVTDLSPHLVRRALRSLNAELRYREHVLQAKKAKDLFELERLGDPDAPPSLVIVVDEFAALVNEVPEFVDGVVNVAQRGRSLGLNLILATQRPAGVIKDNLRANTNLRIALRMADEADSDDVVGSKVAAGFPPGLPGRGVAKTGPGRLIPFQSGYVGGWTSETPPAPAVDIAELVFGTGRTWDAPDTGREETTGPNDLTRLVDSVRGAFATTGLSAPRRPWLDPLADVYDITKSPQSRTDVELVFGVADDADQQSQRHVALRPDEDGGMVVYGTGGTGKSTLLRTLALAAGASIRGGPCHVYGLDFGSRGLSMLETLPHVGAIVNGDDDERVARVLGHLRTLIDERAERYGRVRAGTIAEYRALAEAPQEPRILLLVDNVGAFRQAYEVGEKGRLFDTFTSLAADGRQVGVHVVVSADRSGAVPTALGSLLQRRLVLRLAGESDYAMLGADEDVLRTAPPGRGVMDGLEVQVLIMGSSPSTADQAALVAAYGDSLRALHRTTGTPLVPVPIGRLPEIVRLSEMPIEVGGLPAVGIADDSLEPAGIVVSDVCVLAGPPQSGRSTVLLAVALAVARARPGRQVLLGPARSVVAAGATWQLVASGVAEVAAVARKLVDDLAAWHSADIPLTLVIEGLPDFLQTEADMPLQDLMQACRAAGAFVLVEGETSQLMSSWPLLQAARSSRTGILLQPEQIEGESLFKTSLPRMNRNQFPQGRGVYVRGGRARRIQFALPEV